MSLLLSAVGSRNHDCVWIDLRDSEVAAEMNQIKRTERSGDLDQVHIARGTNEDGDIVDLGTVEVQPEIGDGVVGLRA